MFSIHSKSTSQLVDPGPLQFFLSLFQCAGILLRFPGGWSNPPLYGSHCSFCIWGMCVWACLLLPFCCNICIFRRCLFLALLSLRSLCLSWLVVLLQICHGGPLLCRIHFLFRSVNRKTQHITIPYKLPRHDHVGIKNNNTNKHRQQQHLRSTTMATRALYNHRQL